MSRLTFQEYVEKANSTNLSSYDKPIRRLQSEEIVKLLHGAMGLQTEIGEFMDTLKKYIFYGYPTDWSNLREELGDIMWYVALLSNTINEGAENSLEQICWANLRKLATRYPDKFTEKDALNRDLENEKTALTGDE